MARDGEQQFRDILYAVNNGVAQLTLNKPESLNALSWGSWAEIESAIELANGDDQVKSVVLTGAGRAFCAGTDLVNRGSEETWAPRPISGREAAYKSRMLCTATVYRCLKPTIAAVNGASVGAGFSLAMACDIRIASDAARFSAIFVKRAIVADTGSTWFLPRLVGLERALELLFTGRMVGAEEALRIGLVSEVVAPEKLESRAMELASEIARGPSLAIELNKQLAHDGLHRSLEDQIRMEQAMQAVTHSSEDLAEGRQSFLEKRDPVFKGR